MLRPLLVFWLIVYSFRYLTRPWNFFQLNSDYFNDQKKIFSKEELNHYIPKVWRLSQQLDDGETVPVFPVFVKPEWGQNSHGVELARDSEELKNIRYKKETSSVALLLQEAATEAREFEIFYLRDSKNPATAALLSVTETVNESSELYPVNGIKNRDCSYLDRSRDLSVDEVERLWQMVRSIGFFRIGRVGLRADSIKEMLAGNFHVIEVNIFLPMPLVLLDKQLGWREKHRFIRHCMKGAARLAADRPRSLKSSDKSMRRAIFFHKLVAHYRVKE